MDNKARIMHPHAWHVLLTLGVLLIGMYLLMEFDNSNVGLSFKSSMQNFPPGVSCEIDGPFLCRELYIEHTPFGVDWKNTYFIIDDLSQSTVQDVAIKYITTDYDTCTNIYADHESMKKSVGKEVIFKYNCDDLQPFDNRLFNHQIDVVFTMDDGTEKYATIKIVSG